MTSNPLTPSDVGYWFPPEEFATRRQTVFDRIGPEAHALLQGAGPVRGFEVFRQTNEFLYLSGVEIPQAYLLLDGETRTTSLFLPHRPARGESETLTADDADLVIEQTGLDAVFGLEELADQVISAPVLYTPYSPAEGRVQSRDVLKHYTRMVAADHWAAEPSREEHFIARLQSVAPD